MKKKIYVLLASLVLCFSAVAAPEKDNKTKDLTEQQQARIIQIRERVEEIKAMDKSNLSQQERRQLRKELTEMKKEARVMKGGIYLSVGAIIIIILVLLLIL